MGAELRGGTWVPAGPIQRVVRKELLTQAEKTLEMIIWGKYNNRLRKIFTCEHLSFDVADKILCRLHLNHLWHSDPELSKVYDRPEKSPRLGHLSTRTHCVHGHPTATNLTKQGSCRTCQNEAQLKYVQKSKELRAA